MNIKLTDANLAVKNAKFDMILQKRELKTFVKENSVADQEFQQIVNKEWNIKWNKRSKECKEKVNRLKEKQANVHKKIENKYTAKNKYLKNKHSQNENDQRPS